MTARGRGADEAASTRGGQGAERTGHQVWPSGGPAAAARPQEAHAAGEPTVRPALAEEVAGGWRGRPHRARRGRGVHTRRGRQQQCTRPANGDDDGDDRGDHAPVTAAARPPRAFRGRNAADPARTRRGVGEGGGGASFLQMPANRTPVQRGPPQAGAAEGGARNDAVSGPPPSPRPRLGGGCGGVPAPTPPRPPPRVGGWGTHPQPFPPPSPPFPLLGVAHAADGCGGGGRDGQRPGSPAAVRRGCLFFFSSVSCGGGGLSVLVWQLACVDRGYRLSFSVLCGVVGVLTLVRFVRGALPPVS